MQIFHCLSSQNGHCDLGPSIATRPAQYFHCLSSQNGHCDSKTISRKMLGGTFIASQVKMVIATLYHPIHCAATFSSLALAKLNACIAFALR
jgi:hypothetical protein